MVSNLGHTEVLRRDESKKECVWDKDKGKVDQQGSRLWIWCSTLGSAAFGPHMLGRAETKAKIWCLQQEAEAKWLSCAQKLG